jgi:dihydrodipicolinate synthase/N-acetylneuraminate lyase
MHKERLIDLITKAIELARKAERAGINASLCGTSFDYRSANNADEAFGSAYTELEEAINGL